MFGYIRAFKPELRICEFEAYKGVYCGLCRELGRQFGPIARLTLSYDYTFLAMLAMSLKEESPAVCRRRCVVNPLKRVSCCAAGPEMEYSCDMAALMLWHKLKDNVEDSGFWGRTGARLGLLLSRRAYGKAAARRPALAKTFETTMAQQAALEKSRCVNLDQACDPTATMLGEVFAALSHKEGERRVLRRMGYLLGRYVYMADALDDLDKDQKSHSYNPFLLRAAENEENEEIRRQAVGSLYLTIGELDCAYRLLEPKRFGPILENILLLGLRKTTDAISLPKEKRLREGKW